MAGNFFVNNSNEASVMNLLKVFQQNILSNLHCVKLGYIDSYDYDTRVSRVVIYNKQVVSVTDKGEHITQDYPPLYCKTLFIGGSNCGMTWDIQPGDECIIFFADREIESLWLSGQISDLKYYRMHNYTDAICLTGFRTLPKTTATNENLVLYSKTENAIIRLDNKTTAKEMHVDNGASGTFVSKDDKTVTVVDGVITQIS